MHALYDVGYGTLKSLEVLKALSAGLGDDAGNAIVFDIRMTPRSRDPQWNKKSIEMAVGSFYYYHASEFGNVNYKNGGPILIKDPSYGLRSIEHYLSGRLPVLLLCACKDRATCHRVEVAKLIFDALGVRSMPLDETYTQFLAGAYIRPEIDYSSLPIQKKLFE